MTLQKVPHIILYVLKKTTKRRFAYCFLLFVVQIFVIIFTWFCSLTTFNFKLILSFPFNDLCHAAIYLKLSTPLPN